MPPKKGSKKKKEPELQEPEHDGSWEKVHRALSSTQTLCSLGGSDWLRHGAKSTVTSVLV